MTKAMKEKVVIALIAAAAPTLTALAAFVRGQERAGQRDELILAALERCYQTRAELQAEKTRQSHALEPAPPPPPAAAAPGPAATPAPSGPVLKMMIPEESATARLDRMVGWK